MSGNPVSNPLMQLLDADLNSDRNRAILRFLFGKAGSAIARVFPTRAAACYSGLVTGLALAFVPIAKAAPVKVTLMMTIAGAGLVAVSAHELDELQNDIDEQRTQKERDRQLRLFADTEAKNKVAETNLLRHGYELDKSLPPELQQAISPASSEIETVSPSDRAAFDAAISAAYISQRQTQSNYPAQQQKGDRTLEETTAADPLLVSARPSTHFTTTMAQIAQRLVSMTVVGVPGAGKGMFVLTCCAWCVSITRSCTSS